MPGQAGFANAIGEINANCGGGVGPTLSFEATLPPSPRSRRWAEGNASVRLNECGHLDADAVDSRDAEGVVSLCCLVFATAR
jgi:hypothetical protein